MIVEIASQMILCLVIAAFIGFLIGFFLGRIQKQERFSSGYNYNDYKVRGNVYNHPTILSKPRPTGKDNLKQIEGIDAQLERDLNNLGIFHFDQIAKWSKKNCEWVDKYLELDGKIENDEWISKSKEFAYKIKKQSPNQELIEK